MWESIGNVHLKGTTPIVLAMEMKLYEPIDQKWLFTMPAALPRKWVESINNLIGFP